MHLKRAKECHRSQNMNKIRISVSEIVKDIREKMPDRRLMAKYSLSPHNLAAVKRTLLANKFVTSVELQAQKDNQPGTKRTVNARDFVNDFRNRPDDRYLMGKYCLNPEQLRSVYRALVKAKRLHEWELSERREGSVELEDPTVPPLPASTAINPEHTAAARKKDSDGSPDDLGLPKEFFKDFSGVEIGKQMIEISPEADMVPGEDTPPDKEILPKDPSETVGVLKWGSRQETRGPKKNQK